MRESGRKEGRKMRVHDNEKDDGQGDPAKERQGGGRGRGDSA
jgi:hypothetical protein